MNSYQRNYTTKNQRDLYPNNVPGLNPIQASNTLNNSNEINPQQSFLQPIKTNPIVQRYSPVKIITSQINLSVPKSNIITNPPIHNENVIQPQAFITNTSKIIYKKPKNINNNLVNIKKK